MKIAGALLLTLCIVCSGQSQSIDILIKNGHVIDPKNNIDAVMDVAITGNKISEIAAKISKPAKKT